MVAKMEFDEMEKVHLALGLSKPPALQVPGVV